MTRTPEIIATEIGRWNTQDVRALRSLIAELNDAARDADIDVQHVIDMTALPSAEIPADVDTGYPVWAVDVNGNMLVGDDAMSIETLDEYRAR